jgi:hypothetical protein
MTAGVIDSGDKFFAGDNDAGADWGLWGVYGCVFSWRRLEISPFSFELILAAEGASNQGV